MFPWVKLKLAPINGFVEKTIFGGSNHIAVLNIGKGNSVSKKGNSVPKKFKHCVVLKMTCVCTYPSGPYV